VDNLIGVGSLVIVFLDLRGFFVEFDIKLYKGKIFCFGLGDGRGVLKRPGGGSGKLKLGIFWLGGVYR
jgi:hypothetical protein